MRRAFELPGTRRKRLAAWEQWTRKHWSHVRRATDLGGHAAGWDSLSEVDYWAELASDKPLTTTTAAKEIVEQAKDVAKALPQPDQRVRALAAIGQAQISRGRYEAARQIFEEAEQLVRSIPAEDARASAGAYVRSVRDTSERAEAKLEALERSEQNHGTLSPQQLAEAAQSAHAEGFRFGETVARDAPALWLEAVLAREPRMPSDLEARLLQGSSLPIDSLLSDDVRHALRRGFWDGLKRAEPGSGAGGGLRSLSDPGDGSNPSAGSGRSDQAPSRGSARKRPMPSPRTKDDSREQSGRASPSRGGGTFPG